MRSDVVQLLDPAQPALVVTYGFTPQKVRPLTGDLVVLGKGRACDVGLMSPEVAETHCVLFRAGRGWRLRDCGSRLGTRVNGKVMHETALCDGDVLQVGNFTFRLHLPGAIEGGSPAELRLHRSRRRLAGLALHLRRRLREGNAAHANQAELDRTMALLRERLRECDQKAERLRQEERDLAQDRAALDGEYAALQARIDEAEEGLARRQREVEADLRRRWQDRTPAAEPGTPPPGKAEEARQLERRRQELDAYAASLLRQRDREAAVGKELEALRQENERLRRLVTQPPAEVEELRELRAQLAAARRENQEKDAQIQQLQAQPRFPAPSPASTDLETYGAELEAFRRRLNEDREGLNVEIRELRARTLALEEAARVREQQLAQEWADLSAERAELNRLRGEGGGEAEHPVLPAPTGRLTGTHRLKGTMVGRVVSGPPKPASAGRIPRVRLPRRGDA